MRFKFSKRLLIAIIIFTGLLFLQLNPLIITLTVFAIALIYNRKTVLPLKSFKFWIIIVFLLVLVPLFTGFQDSSVFGISYSSEQLQKMTLMTMRGISVFLLFQVITIDLNASKIKSIFTKFGIKNFDILYNLSTEIFPKIKSILTARYNIFRSKWKTTKSFQIIINFCTEIFTDLFQLIEQMSTQKPDKNEISPTQLIEQIKIKQNSQLIIIIGDTGSGKTTFIKELINSIQITGESVDGLFAEKVFKNDDTWYHNLIRISTNEFRKLTSMQPLNSEIKVGQFYFDKNSLAWGNNQLKSMPLADWIFIDEIGILEFEGGGLLSGMQALVKKLNGKLIITLRQNLVQRFPTFLEEHLPELYKWNQTKILI